MFHHNLKRLRAAAGLTQAELAAKLNTPLRTVQNWEQGHREPGLDALRPIARALGVSVDELLADEPAKKNAKRRKGASHAS
jgi:transcriptional regulator with XRE-family HTH domain